MRRAHLISFALVLVSLAVALALYSRLPDPVPTHWDLAGRPNGWTPKPLGALLMTLVQLGVTVLLALAPRLSPRRFAIADFGRAYGKIEIVIAVFLTAVNGVALAEAAGMPIVGMPRFVFAGIGLLFVALGNYLGKVTPNFFIGIRTPWTLASREVWSRTHRLAGWLFVGGGLALTACGLIAPSVPLFVSVVAVVALVPVVYSYVLYLRLDGSAADPDDDAGDDAGDDEPRDR